MKKMKKNWIIALSCGVLACGVAGVAGLGANVADANTEQKFEMLSGAAVCIADGASGIRWTTTVNEAFYNSLPNGAKEFGVLVTPRNNIAAGSELTAASPEVVAIPCESTVKFTNGEFTYYSSIVYSDLTEADAQKAYAVELAARAYVKVGETYYYAPEYEACTRSMRSVAYDVYRINPEYADLVGKYYGNGEVEKSEIASGYFSEMDGIATLTNVNDLANGTYKGSVNAQPVSVKVNGSTMTVEGELYGLTAGENYQLNVFGDENNITTQPFMYVTLAIDEASDMNLFHHGGKGGWLGKPDYKIDDSEFTEADKFDGYYILVKNIDMTGSVFNTQVNIKDAYSRLSGTLLKDYGLTGTFDGNGYAIENYLPVQYGGGLFAVINGGTVKNVKISAPEGNDTKFNCSYLSSAIRDAKFENVYIKMPLANRSGLYAQVLCYYMRNTTFENCIFDTPKGSTYYHGLFATLEDKAANGDATTFTDCYFINNMLLNQPYDSSNHGANKAPVKYEASNQKPEGDLAGTIYEKTVWLDGIKRYATVADLEKAEATNEFTSFEASNCWTVETGKVPAWKGVPAAVLCDSEGNVVDGTLALALNATVELTAKQNGVVCDNPTIEITTNGSNIEVEGSKITAIGAGESTIVVRYAAYGKAYEQEIVVTSAKATETYAKMLTFSAMDGLFFDGAEVVSIETILGGAELSSVEHATDTLTVSEGAILGLNTNGTAAVSTQIALDTADKKVLVNVNAYTLVIDEAEDMNLFHHDGKGLISGSSKFDPTQFSVEEDSFAGYYILVKDIDMNGSLFNTTASYKRGMYVEAATVADLGLTGTFDGNGHRLYNFSPVYAGGGLFLAVNGGTVKNLSLTKDKASSINDLPYFAAVLNGATIENVYINVNYDLSSGANSPVLIRDAKNTTFKNCIFTDKTSKEDYIGLVRYASGSTNFENCYYISNAKIAQMWKDGGWKAYDGVNQTANYTVAGISRYATVADLEATEKDNAFTSFDNGYWTVVTGKLPVWNTKA